MHVFLTIASRVSQLFFPENNTGGDASARFVGHPIFQRDSANLLSRTNGF
jgi:hypothetical protein